MIDRDRLILNDPQAVALGVWQRLKGGNWKNDLLTRWQHGFNAKDFEPNTLQLPEEAQIALHKHLMNLRQSIIKQFPDNSPEYFIITAITEPQPA